MNNDLISRSALMELAHNHIGGTVDCNDIARFPGVDAVKVVRCNMCNHYEMDTGFCDYLYTGRHWDDFCSRGVKMVAEV